MKTRKKARKRQECGKRRKKIRPNYYLWKWIWFYSFLKRGPKVIVKWAHSNRNWLEIGTKEKNILNSFENFVRHFRKLDCEETRPKGTITEDNGRSDDVEGARRKPRDTGGGEIHAHICMKKPTGTNRISTKLESIVNKPTISASMPIWCNHKPITCIAYSLFVHILCRKFNWFKRMF